MSETKIARVLKKLKRFVCLFVLFCKQKKINNFIGYSSTRVNTRFNKNKKIVKNKIITKMLYG